MSNSTGCSGQPIQPKKVTLKNELDEIMCSLSGLVQDTAVIRNVFAGERSEINQEAKDRPMDGEVFYHTRDIKSLILTIENNIATVRERLA